MCRLQMRVYVFSTYNKHWTGLLDIEPVASRGALQLKIANITHVPVENQIIFCAGANSKTAVRTIYIIDRRSVVNDDVVQSETAAETAAAATPPIIIPKTQLPQHPPNPPPGRDSNPVQQTLSECFYQLQYHAMIARLYLSTLRRRLSICETIMAEHAHLEKLLDRIIITDLRTKFTHTVAEYKRLCTFFHAVNTARPTSDRECWADNLNTELFEITRAVDTMHTTMADIAAVQNVPRSAVVLASAKLTYLRDLVNKYMNLAQEWEAESKRVFELLQSRAATTCDIAAFSDVLLCHTKQLPLFGQTEQQTEEIVMAFVASQREHFNAVRRALVLAAAVASDIYTLKALQWRLHRRLTILHRNILYMDFIDALPQLYAQCVNKVLHRADSDNDDPAAEIQQLREQLAARTADAAALQDKLIEQTEELTAVREYNKNLESALLAAGAAIGSIETELFGTTSASTQRTDLVVRLDRLKQALRTLPLNAAAAAASKNESHRRGDSALNHPR